VHDESGRRIGNAGYKIVGQGTASMTLFGFPFRYLLLQDGARKPLYRRDIIGISLTTLVVATPFILIPGANFFHKDGFIDKIGAFSSVLTGFYIAGLIAVTTFPLNKDGLDKIIDVGPIQFPSSDDSDPDWLTRREYVCAMFGYLAFMSLAITIASISCVTISDISKYIGNYTIELHSRYLPISKGFLRSIPLILSSAVMSSMLVTTCRALYYLMDRLYAKSPTPISIAAKPESVTTSINDVEPPL
jgi:hypothetical protein